MSAPRDRLNGVELLRPAAYDDYVAGYLERDRIKGGSPVLAEPRRALEQAHAGKVRPWFNQATWWWGRIHDAQALARLQVLATDWTERAGLVHPGRPRDLGHVLERAMHLGYLHRYQQGPLKHALYLDRLARGELRLQPPHHLVLCSAERDDGPPGSLYLHDGLGRALPYLWLVHQGRLPFEPVDVLVALKPADAEVPATSHRGPSALLDGAFHPLPHRGLFEYTTRRWGYQVGVHRGLLCELATYCDLAGRPVAQKARFATKQWRVFGDLGAAPLYGRWLLPDRGESLCIVEGELDAMSIDQALAVPVVSLKNGVSDVERELSEARAWLDGYERIVLLFDDDEHGRTAAGRAQRVLGPGRAWRALISGKDANELLVRQQVPELARAVAHAHPLDGSPDGVPRTLHPAGLFHRTGRGLGHAWTCDPDQHEAGHMVFGPYMRGLPGGSWCLEVDLGEGRAGLQPAVTIDVQDTARWEQLARRRCSADQARGHVALPFSCSDDAVLEFRVYWHGRVPVTIERLRLFDLGKRG